MFKFPITVEALPERIIAIPLESASSVSCVEFSMDQAQASPDGFEERLREVVAHLGTALVQSDITDDPIIIGHVRSAHALALGILHAGQREPRVQQ